MKVEVYTKDACPYCVQAKKLLESKGIEFEERHINASTRDMLLEELTTRIGTPPRTVPQIFIDDEAIGGYTDLVTYFKTR